MKSNLEDDLKKAGVEGFQTEVVFKFFIDRVRANLHVALCMSPVGEMFRYILCMFVYIALDSRYLAYYLQF